MGFEPMTSSLPRKRSTPELRRPKKRAGNEARTRDLQLGRLSLYQLSYSRLIFLMLWGEQDSNLRRRSQQIYSLPHLATLESPQTTHNNYLKTSRWTDSNRRPADYKSAALTN